MDDDDRRAPASLCPRGSRAGSDGGQGHRLGDKAGNGSKVKILNQLLAGVHIAAAAEAMAMALGVREDVPPEQLYEVITHEFHAHVVGVTVANLVMDADSAQRCGLKPQPPWQEATTVLSSIRASSESAGNLKGGVSAFTRAIRASICATRPGRSPQGWCWPTSCLPGQGGQRQGDASLEAPAS